MLNEYNTKKLSSLTILLKVLAMEGNTTVETTNSSLNTSSGRPINEHSLRLLMYILFYVTCFLYITIFVFGCLSNALFCSIIMHYRQLHTPFNALAFMLSLNNLFGSLTAAPSGFILTYVYHKTSSVETPFCKLSVFFFNFWKWPGVLIMAEIAIIRARCIFSKRTRSISFKKIKMMVVMNIVLSSVFATYRSYLSDMNICMEKYKPDSMIVNVITWLLLFTVLLLGYNILNIAAWRKTRTLSRAERHGKRFEIATLKASSIIVSCYLVCHMPTIIYSLYIAYTETSYWFCLHSLFVSILSLTFVIDALILTVSSSQYRKHVRMFLKWSDTKPYKVRT